jgi:hypothetical protein
LHGAGLMVDQQQSRIVSTKFFVIHRFLLTEYPGRRARKRGAAYQPQ